jgi:HlyD family secretion protein
MSVPPGGEIVNDPIGNPNGGATPQDAAGRNGPLSLRERVQSLRLPDRPPPRRSPLALLPWVLCLIFFVAAVVMGMRASPSAPSETDEESRRDRDKSLAAAAPAAIAPGDVMLESKGYIVPIHQIQVSPKVSGMIVSLRTSSGALLEEGLVVKKGDVMAVLEKVDYESERDSAKAQVGAARNRYEELALSLEFQVKQATHDLEDAEAQYQTEYVQYQSEIQSREATAQVDLLKRKMTLDGKTARVNWQKNQVAMINKGSLARKMDAAKGDLEQLQAALVKAEWRLDNCVVTAPVTGVILVKRAEEGSLVNPSAFSNGLSASLCDMADLAELEVDLAVPERDVARVISFRLEHKKPQKCQVRADAFPNRVYDAFVSRIMPTADQSKAAVPVRVKIVVPFSEAGIYLRPQMNAAVTFLNAESTVGGEVRPQGEGEPGKK